MIHKNIKKTLTALSILACVGTSNAQKNDEWTVHYTSNGVPAAFSPFVVMDKATLYLNAHGTIYFQITSEDFNGTCSDLFKDKEDISTINGQKVRFEVGCVDDKEAFFVPSSNKGRDYIINELETKKTVNLSDWVTFSAKGYNKAVKSVRMKTHGLQEVF